MNFLQQLPQREALTDHIAWGKGKKANFLLLKGHQKEDFEALEKLNDPFLAVFIPNDWVLLREKMDQNWTINLPKGKGEETLYSTTFFWNSRSEEVEKILRLAAEKEWAVYTEVDQKLCLLVLNSRVGVDVDAEKVMGQLV